MDSYKELPLLPFSSASEWEVWLDANHASATAVWIQFAKKGSGVPTITYEEARDLAIAYGWIDGLINQYDERFFVRRFTPRKPKSGWSKINCDIAEALIAVGKMRPSGFAHVEAAKSGGRWELAYDSPSNMTVPDDFRQALDNNPTASAAFAALKSANRYAFLHRLQTARTPELRALRIAKFVCMLESGQVFHAKASSSRLPKSR